MCAGKIKHLFQTIWYSSDIASR